MVECLPSKCKALVLRETEREREGERERERERDENYHGVRKPKLCSKHGNNPVQQKEPRISK
jgi:hypothetical protein